MLELGAQNHEDSDIRGDREEEKDTILTRAPIFRKKKGLLKDADAMLNYEHHKVTGVNDQNLQDAIGTVFKSMKRFSKRNQMKADALRRFQHVTGHPSDETMSY